jgi:hypothetical protein
MHITYIYIDVWRRGDITPSFLTLALDVGDWTSLRRGRLPSEKEPPIPIGWEAGWAPEQVWTIWKRESLGPAGSSIKTNAWMVPKYSVSILTIVNIRNFTLHALL